METKTEVAIHTVTTVTIARTINADAIIDICKTKRLSFMWEFIIIGATAILLKRGRTATIFAPPNI